MWIATETATSLGLGNEFFDRDPDWVTPPGSRFLRNAERLYAIWLVATNAAKEGTHIEALASAFPTTDDQGLRTFQGRVGIGAHRAASEWLVVMLTTLLEAYIKDVLTFIAVRDSSIMRDHPEAITIATDEIDADSGIASHSEFFAQLWARSWFRARKGPLAWLNGFRRLGVPNFHEGLGDALHEMLGIRHLVVHSGGIVDEDYLRLHPETSWSAGDEIQIDDDTLRYFIAAAFDLFAPVEAHFVQKYVRRSGPAK